MEEMKDTADEETPGMDESIGILTGRNNPEETSTERRLLY
jgi:hypothetical protein